MLQKSKLYAPKTLGAYLFIINIIKYKMSVLLYCNGIIEELEPQEEFVFNEEEITNIFKEYHTIRTKRLSAVPNCWCVWGEMDDPPHQEFNKIGTEIAAVSMFSPVLFLHDSEVDPDWNLTEMLVTEYSYFVEDVKAYITEVADEIMKLTQMDNPNPNGMIFLSAVGHTEDKKVMFAFNPNLQHENFYTNGSFNDFADKMYSYLVEKFKEKRPFTIYADSKTIVLIEDHYVKTVLDRMITLYMSQEDYEKCSKLTCILSKWQLFMKPENIDSSTGKKKRKPRKTPEK